MNYFHLDKDPHKCAKYHLDKHVVKMNIEYPQMLSTAHRLLDGDQYQGKSKTGRNVKRWRHPNDEMENILYKVCHVHHPTSVWVRESKANYQRLYDVWLELLREYTYRYGKIHLSGKKLVLPLAKAPSNIPDLPYCDPPPAMKAYPQCIVEGDSVTTYRNYYKEAKSGFAKWTKRPIPKWYNNGSN